MKKGKILWKEEKRGNILHPQGKQLLLSAAFLREADVPQSWYIGLDNRSHIGKSDTLKEVVAHEPKSEDYARVDIYEKKGFSSFWQESENQSSGEPPEFTISASAEFIPNEDWGIVRNIFLTSASHGSDGILVSSLQMKKPRELDEEMSIDIGFLLNLKEKKEDRDN